MEMKGKAKGGQVKNANLTPEQRREQAMRMVTAKKDKAMLPKATHGSPDHPLKLGGSEIPCFVLEDGTRVLSQRGVAKAMGFSEGGDRLGKFVSSRGIKPYINNELLPALNSPIRFINPSGGGIAHGYPATLLPDICDAVLDARKRSVLNEFQKQIADQCEILVRGFARVGIIALVDEATGYQKDRARDALAKILEAFVAKELQPYVKKFPAEFYEQMFRLRGLPFDTGSIKRPPYFGHLTNDVIYRRLAPGVWKELKSKVKKNSDGRATQHLHRHLTPEIGDPRLKELLTKVVTVMLLSEKWSDFKAKLERVVPAYDDTLQLPFELKDDTGEGL